MKKLIVFAIVIVLVGCVSPQSVKKASTDMTATLLELQQAEKTMHSLYLAEIDKTIRVVEDAIVAQETTRTVKTLTAEESKGDFIEISKKISNIRKNTRWIIGGYMVTKNKTPKEYIATKPDDLRAAAQQMANQGSLSVAEKMRKAADGLEKGGLLKNKNPDIETGLQVLSELKKARSEAVENLKPLQAHISAFLAIHSIIDDWIQTDVTVSGEEIANVIIDIEKLKSSGTQSIQ